MLLKFLSLICSTIQNSDYSTESNFNLLQDSQQIDNSKYLDSKNYRNLNNNRNISISKGNYTTDTTNITPTLLNELNDVSSPVRNKLVEALENHRKKEYDASKFKDVISINKKITKKGKQKIVNIHVSEKLVPIKNNNRLESKVIDEDDVVLLNDFGIRAFFGGFLFLIAGLFFTIFLKFYKNYAKLALVYKNNHKENILKNSI